MLDHIHLHTRAQDRAPSQHMTVNVTEKRAPTDEAVRLLKEMEEKALQSILGAIKLESIPFDCRVFPILEYMNQSIKFIVLYKIGTLDPLGRRWDATDMTRFEHSVPLWDKPSMEKIVGSLLDALGASITRTLLTPASSKLVQDLRVMPLNLPN